MIEVSDLRYEYPATRALDRVSFQVAAHGITALVGPNGAGKTTLLRCLAGLTRPLAGDIHIDGIDVIAEPRRSHRVLGYLSDTFGLYGALSISQCLTHAGAANGLTGAALRRAVQDTAERLGLAARLAQATAQLSRGLRQRVAIAQAIVHKPRVVLLDEPASGLDPEARIALGELFVDLQAQGMTLIVSSHVLAELETYSTHMLVLDGGRVIEHRSLRDPAAPELEIEVLSDIDAARTVLARQTAVSRLTVQGNSVRFTFAGDLAARPALLRALVGAGVDITHFGAVRSDLQQSYLESVKTRSRA